MKSKIFLLPFVSFLIIIASCSYFKYEEPIKEVNLLELLIEPSDMPTNWSLANYGLGHAIDPYRSEDAAGIIFLSDLNPEALGVGQEVYRFKTVIGARDDYSKVISSLLHPDEFHPTEWKYQSENADESYSSCRTYPNITICEWIARYKNIVIQFRGSLIENRFSLIDMERLIIKIDEKATMLLINKTTKE